MKSPDPSRTPEPRGDSRIAAYLQSVGIASDPVFARQLLDMYISQSKVQLDALRAALGGKDGSRIRFAAHVLRGSSSTVGAADLATMCERIEELGLSGDVTGARALLPDLESSYVATVAEVDRLIASFTSPAG